MLEALLYICCKGRDCVISLTATDWHASRCKLLTSGDKNDL